MSDEKTKFNLRGFVSVVTALSFLGLAVTGIVMFITPPGRIANWTGWTFMGLGKHQWGGLHIWMSALFLLATILHIYYNWKVLLNYFKSKVSRHFALRAEWVTGLVLFGVIFVGTLADVTPFTTLLDWNESIKNSWEKQDELAPIPHAELLTLAELATEAKTEVETMVANLAAKGIKVTSFDAVVGDMAEAHNMSPHELYKKAMTAPGQSGGGAGRGGGYGGSGAGGHGRGLGQKPLKEFCEIQGLDLAQTLAKLKAEGYEVTEEMRMFDIAKQKNMKPYELVELMRNQ